MRLKDKLLLGSALFLIIAAMLLTCGGCRKPATTQAATSGTTKRIVLVQSYWNNYLWGVEIELGVLRALGFPEHMAPNAPRIVDGIGIKEGVTNRMGDRYELLIIYMDTKRRPDQKWKEESGRIVLAMIEEFSPDVAILADDNAQAYVGRHIAGRIPVVFCGVNADYTTYYSQGGQCHRTP